MWIEETNGKYKFCERYTDPLTLKLKKVSVTMDRNTAATRKLATEELQRKIEKKTIVVSYENTTIKQLYDKYAAYQRQTMKASTCERNERTLKKLCKLFGDDSIVDNLNVAYVNSVLLEETTNPTTLNEYIKRFKAMLNWGYTNEYINNIALITKLKKFRDIPYRMKIEDKYLEPEEVAKLLEHMQHSRNLEWYYVTYFQILSGMRIGEIIALTMKDITKDIIHVTKTYDVVNCIVTEPKTICSVRDIFAQDELLTLIRRIKLYEKEKRLKNGIRSDLLFCDDQGSYLHYSAYNKYLKETCEKLFNRRITTHALRHTHASLLLAEGVSVDAISRRLGHENSRITKEIYLHVIEKLKEKDKEELKMIRIIS